MTATTRCGAAAARARSSSTIGVPGKPAPFMSGEPFHRCTHTALSPNGRNLRLGRLRQCARAQVLARRQARHVLGRIRHRARAVQYRPQYRHRRRQAGSTSPIARTIACRCSTATANTRRSGTTCTGPAASICCRGKTPTFVIGELGPGMPVNLEGAQPGTAAVHRRRRGQADRAPRAARTAPGWSPASSSRRMAWRSTPRATSTSARSLTRTGRPASRIRRNPRRSVHCRSLRSVP